MSERIPVRIKFGGKLQIAFVPALIALLSAQRLRTAELEMMPTPDNLHEEFYHGEVSCGDLTDLEDFAIHHGLAYESWCDSGLEWLATTTRFMPQSQRIAHVAGSRDTGFYLNEAQLKNAAELLTWMKAPLPALEIIAANSTVISGSPETTKQGKPSYCVKITQVLRVQKSTIVYVEADDEADIAAMIDEGSIDVPCADDNTFDTWTIDHASLENETQERIE